MVLYQNKTAKAAKASLTRGGQQNPADGGQSILVMNYGSNIMILLALVCALRALLAMCCVALSYLAIFRIQLASLRRAKT